MNRNSTKRYQPIVSRNKFQPIYTKALDLKKDDAHTIDPRISNLATQDHHIRSATTSIVPGNLDFNNAVIFGRKAYIKRIKSYD